MNLPNSLPTLFAFQTDWSTKAGRQRRQSLFNCANETKIKIRSGVQNRIVGAKTIVKQKYSLQLVIVTS